MRFMIVMGWRKYGREDEKGNALHGLRLCGGRMGVDNEQHALWHGMALHGMDGGHWGRAKRGLRMHL